MTGSITAHYLFSFPAATHGLPVGGMGKSGEDRPADAEIILIPLKMDVDVVDAVIAQGTQLIQTILSSAPSDFSKVKSLVDAGAPLWFQEEGGLSALHAACFVENSQLVELLIEKGAVWNCVDDLGNTAADVALSLNDETSYRIIRDAGIRTEYLLQVLSSKSDSPPESVIRQSDSGPFESTEEFLNSNLVFSQDAHGQDVCSVVSGDTTIGVMMGWERGIMQTTVEKLCASHPSLPSGLRILNIGFGLGIIDSFFQSLDPAPSQHTIIEPHKDVLAHMRSQGWYDKSGVKILEGRWQDFINTGEIFGEGGWDVVYVDTFAEGYEELKRFFDIVPDLLSGPDAGFSFFNGLGATNAVFYDVYTQLAEMHLQDAGVAVNWTEVDTENIKTADRWGGTREYFKLRLYRLPIGKMVQV